MGGALLSELHEAKGILEGSPYMELSTRSRVPVPGDVELLHAAVSPKPCSPHFRSDIQEAAYGEMKPLLDSQSGEREREDRNKTRTSEKGEWSPGGAGVCEGPISKTPLLLLPGLPASVQNTKPRARASLFSLLRRQ